MKTPFTSLVLGVSVSLCNAQWAQTNGPLGGQVLGFTTSTDGQYVFAGISGQWENSEGVFRSSDDGISWTQVKEGLTERHIHSFATCGPYLFAGTALGIFRSSNNGNSWEEVNQGLTDPLVTALAVSGTNIFAGTCYFGDRGVHLSTNFGESWTVVNNGLTYRCINRLTTLDTNVFAGTWGGGVFRTTNNGTSWTPVNDGLPANCSGDDFAVMGNSIYVAIGQGLFVSTNNGTSWSPTGFTQDAYHCIALGTNLFVGNSGGIFRSTDGGNVWIGVNSGIPSGCGTLSFGTHGNTLYTGSTKIMGAFRSTNYGDSWTAVGFPVTTVLGLASDDRNLFAGTFQSGVYRSTNGGASWKVLTSDFTNRYAGPVFAVDSVVLAESGGLYRSTNHGLDWAATGLNIGVSAFVTSGTNLFVGGNGIFVSTDNGVSWTERGSGISENDHVFALATSGVNLFAGTYEGVFRSTNNGAYWTQTALTNTVDALSVVGSNLFAGIWGDGIFVSPDNGTSWTAVNTGLTNLRIHAFATDGVNLFASTTLIGSIFLSTNSGTSWSEVSLGLPELNEGELFGISALAIQDSFLYVGTGSYIHSSPVDGAGVWKRPLSEMITDVRVPTELPTRFALQQNYPNPFNPSTIIKYQIPNTIHVLLKVFDLLGREVATLVNEVKQPGTYTVQFDGTGLASGVYFYRLQAGDFVAAKKLLLAK